MDTQSLAYSSMILAGSAFLCGLSVILGKYISKHPGKSKAPNGKTPIALGTGNGIGISMFGEFNRKDGIKVSYTFLCFFLPILPLGCYASQESSFVSHSHKRQTTTYKISGSQPWRLIEILVLYFKYWGFTVSLFCIISCIVCLFI